MFIGATTGPTPSQLRVISLTAWTGMEQGTEMDGTGMGGNETGNGGTGGGLPIHNHDASPLQDKNEESSSSPAFTPSPPNFQASQRPTPLGPSTHSHTRFLPLKVRGSKVSTTIPNPGKIVVINSNYQEPQRTATQWNQPSFLVQRS
ncbi:hypothetical protein ONZ45_g13103 [Pleurotus djamor]|nr:hypothetical protein ONZ45_g13103 [Pleurotus djamor]